MTSTESRRLVEGERPGLYETPVLTEDALDCCLYRISSNELTPGVRRAARPKGSSYI
jgi:hypothetical protein